MNQASGYNFNFVSSKKKKLGEIDIILSTYNLPFLKKTGPRSYFAYNNKKLFLITGNGLLMYSSLKNIQKNLLNFKVINSNIKKLITKNYSPVSYLPGTPQPYLGINISTTIVKNILVHEEKIYISYVKKVNEECYMNAILVSEPLHLHGEEIISQMHQDEEQESKELSFQNFFETKECQLTPVQPGGNLSNYTKNKILLTVGSYAVHEKIEHKSKNNAQNLKSLTGKILSIDTINKSHQILSSGHRNSQGLFYDKKYGSIYSTDHGPQGGDEVNIKNSSDSEIKNFGWPISSYGEHYGYPDFKGPGQENNQTYYENSPLYKSHSKYGFVEPLKYFVPSIAPTQIIKTEEFIKVLNKNVIYIGALGNNVKEGDLSIHQFILSDSFKLEQHNILPIGERVRDLIYIPELKKIFLFLESTASIGVLEVVN